MTKQKKLNSIFSASVIERFMRTNDICKCAYRMLIDKELPKGSNGSFFEMSIDTGTYFYIKVQYHDSTDERYAFGVAVQKGYIIPVERGDNTQVALYKYIKRLGDIHNMFCFESSTKTDAECTVSYFDNLFTRRCRKEKIKFSGYGEYKYWRKACKKFLCETTEKYSHLNFTEKFGSSFLKEFTK